MVYLWFINTNAVSLSDSILILNKHFSEKILKLPDLAEMLEHFSNFFCNWEIFFRNQEAKQKQGQRPRGVSLGFHGQNYSLHRIMQNYSSSSLEKNGKTLTSGTKTAWPGQTHLRYTDCIVQLI